MAFVLHQEHAGAWPLRLPDGIQNYNISKHKVTQSGFLGRYESEAAV